MPYLSKSELAGLKSYKYQSGLYGFIDTVVMTPFWNRVVEFLPRSMAPNLVTLLALLAITCSTVLVFFHSPTLSGPMPAWVLYFSALCMFLYQTLDAIDGKQARRTGSSSPLGQLFDHGCDSVSATMMVLEVAATLNLGSGWQLWLLFLVFTVPFYGTNWEECQTGMMRFGEFSVTESQFSMMLFMLISACKGPLWWSQPLLGYPLNHWILFIITIGILNSFMENIVAVLRCKTRSEHVWMQLFQFFFFVLSVGLWLLAPGHDWLTQHPFLALATAGACFSYLINRLILSNVCSGRFQSLYVIMWPLPLLVLNVWLPVLSSSFSAPPIDPFVAGSAFAVFAFVLYTHFVCAIINEICAYLGIRAFVISTAHKKQ